LGATGDHDFTLKLSAGHTYMVWVWWSYIFLILCSNEILLRLILLRSCSSVFIILHHQVSPSFSRLTTMDFYLFLSFSALFPFSYVAKPVRPVMSSKLDEILHLRLTFLPHTFLSNMHRCVWPLDLLSTCPAYSSFLFLMSIEKCYLDCTLARTSKLVTFSVMIIHQFV